MDYHVFILSRIRELWSRLFTAEGIVGGIASSAGVVTSAALIMVAVFSIFLTLPLIELKILGSAWPPQYSSTPRWSVASFSRRALPARRPRLAPAPSPHLLLISPSHLISLHFTNLTLSLTLSLPLPSLLSPLLLSLSLLSSLSSISLYSYLPLLIIFISLLSHIFLSPLLSRRTLTSSLVHYAISALVELSRRGLPPRLLAHLAYPLFASIACLGTLSSSTSSLTFLFHPSSYLLLSSSLSPFSLFFSLYHLFSLSSFIFFFSSLSLLFRVGRPSRRDRPPQRQGATPSSSFRQG